MAEMREQRQARKPYQRPVLKPVELAAAEVLAQGCKQRLSGSAFGGTPCAVNNCAKKSPS